MAWTRLFRCFFFISPRAEREFPALVFWAYQHNNKLFKGGYFVIIFFIARK